MGSDDLERELGRLCGAMESLTRGFDTFQVKVSGDIHDLRDQITAMKLADAVERGQRAGELLGSKRVLGAIIAVAGIAGAGGAKALEKLAALILP